MAVSPLPAAPLDVPPFVQAWVRQLLDPEILELLRHSGNGRVDLCLSANGGEVRRRPVVTIGGRAGPRDDSDL